MRMRFPAMLATAMLVASTMIIVGAGVVAAGGSVPRYQFRTATLTANVNSGAYIHTYTITLNPCDGSFTGTAAAGSVVPGETIDGSFSNAYIDINSDALYPNGYAWTYDGPLSGGTGYGPNGQTFTVSFSLTNVANSSTFTNHGDFVSQQPDKNDAAHSCIGMPLPHSWSASGTVDSSSPVGTTITLPDTATGIYLIQMSGYWLNTPHGEVDAQYNNGDNGVQNGAWTFVQEGWPTIAPDWGRVLVNGADVDWGAYANTHTYSIVMPLAGSATLQMGVNDGPGPLSWYSDNVGSLSYTITYLQP